MFGFKKKIKRPFSDEELLKQYKDGKILQVDKKVDNKLYLAKLNEKSSTEEKTEPIVKKKWNFLKIFNKFKKNKGVKDG